MIAELYLASLITFLLFYPKRAGKFRDELNKDFKERFKVKYDALEFRRKS